MSKKDDIEALEKKIPELALKAFREAFEKAKASGRPYAMVDGDELVLIHPDGRREVLKRVKPDVQYHVKSGSTSQ
ncbi:MAG: hypothetical protein KDB82_00300 [Planctomycetes bacterium]|nr:hypothetical protein [Planctomycetota bacterium]